MYDIAYYTQHKITHTRIIRTNVCLLATLFKIYICLKFICAVYKIVFSLVSKYRSKRSTGSTSTQSTQVDTYLTVVVLCRLPVRK